MTGVESREHTLQNPRREREERDERPSHQRPLAPCGRQHKGISIRNNNEAEQSVVAAVLTRSMSSHPHLRSHSPSFLATPRTDQRSLYDGFQLHSTKAFGPRSKASRTPCCKPSSRTFLLLVSSASLETQFPTHNRPGGNGPFCVEFVAGKLSRSEQGRAQTPPRSKERKKSHDSL
jgi:hypothetical protein